MPHEKNPFLLTRKESAEFLGVSEKRIKNLAAMGKLKPWVVEGKEYFYQEELARWRMDEREVEINTAFSHILKVMGYGLKLIVHGRNGRHRELSADDLPKGGE